MNKKKKRDTATILIVLVLGFLLVMNGGLGRAGVNTDFNAWYGDNSVGVLIAGVFALVMLILWGFYEGKGDRTLRLAREEVRIRKMIR